MLRIAVLTRHLLVACSSGGLEITELQAEGGKRLPAVEALIPHIEHPISGDLAQSGLFYLLSEHFDTVEQATNTCIHEILRRPPCSHCAFLQSLRLR